MGEYEKMVRIYKKIKNQEFYLTKVSFMSLPNLI